MNDSEKIIAFGEMVEATERLSERSSKPWKLAFIISNIAHVVVELALAVLLGMMIYMAYMEPVEYGQEQVQDFDGQTQSQTYHYGEGAMHGD